MLLTATMFLSAALLTLSTDAAARAQVRRPTANAGQARGARPTPQGTGFRFPSERELDAYVSGEMRKRHIPGLSLVVLYDGLVIKEKGYGLASVELQVAATPQTVYQLASTTKVFTGTAVMLLVEEGKLSLDERVRKLLPELPAAWDAITVRQCLTHTSGLPDAVLSDDTDEVIAPNGPEALRKLAAMPLLSRPGEKWEYNQTGYYLLGLIIEKLSGQTFEEFLARRFFRPLGMTSTVFGDSSAVVAGRSTLYTRYVLREGKLVASPDNSIRTTQFTYPDYLHTGAGLNTSVADMAKWDAALSTGRILKPATLAEMWTATKLKDGRAFRFDDSTLGYGGGWMVDDTPGHKSAGHTGGDATAYIRFLDDRLSIVVLTNCQGAGPDDIVGGVAALYVPALAGDIEK
jgi:CubicO group peptidase (beta-lactamase class C family)